MPVPHPLLNQLRIHLRCFRAGPSLRSERNKSEMGRPRDILLPVKPAAKIPNAASTALDPPQPQLIPTTNIPDARRRSGTWPCTTTRRITSHQRNLSLTVQPNPFSISDATARDGTQGMKDVASAGIRHLDPRKTKRFAKETKHNPPADRPSGRLWSVEEAPVPTRPARPSSWRMGRRS